MLINPTMSAGGTDQLGHCRMPLGPALVIVATYNEIDNLGTLVGRLLRLPVSLDIVIIDDNSPDGTGKLADQLGEKHAEVSVIHRTERRGLAAALVNGFTWALSRPYEIIVNLDGDLSHDPADVTRLIAAANVADLAVGSRFVDGIRVLNWSPRRLFLSLSAASYVHFITGMPFADPTSGFRCFRRRALQLITNGAILSRGYGFHIESLHKVWRAGLTVKEIPILFAERQYGRSKMDCGIILEAIWITCRMVLQHRSRCTRCTQRSGAAQPPACLPVQ